MPQGKEKSITVEVGAIAIICIIFSPLLTPPRKWKIMYDLVVSFLELLKYQANTLAKRTPKANWCIMSDSDIYFGR